MFLIKKRVKASIKHIFTILNLNKPKTQYVAAL